MKIQLDKFNWHNLVRVIYGFTLFSILPIALLYPIQAQPRLTQKKVTQNVRKKPLSAREIARRAYLSVVSINSEDEEGDIISQGSGFYITPRIIATNYHVIQDAHRIIVQTNDEEIGYDASLLRSDEKADIALLTIKNVTGIAAPLFFGTDYYVGDEIYTIGNPQGLNATFSKGNISALRDIEGILNLQITAPVSPGSSGSPVFNVYGEVIGIVRSQYKEGQNLNFAVATIHLIVLKGGQKGIELKFGIEKN